MITTAVHRRSASVLLLALAMAGQASVPAIAQGSAPAVVGVVSAADDADTAAWAAQPCDAAGALDGRTRFEVAADPGATVTENVLITNSSTVEREFAVYGADAFNTPDGGYDLLAAAEVSTDVGSWVGVGSPTVTIAALSTVVIPFTVTVPTSASPGDHPGGMVISPVRTQVAEDGVVVDTRIAVRLAVRVSGELAPSLEVRSVNGSFEQTSVPFGSSDATVTYEVVNTGNVAVVGVPRVRVTGPFGVALAVAEPEKTRQVLPGDSFTVTAKLTDVEPLFYGTAVVDVTMAAAPGPDTEIPLVSSTGRTGFVAVPWTGLVLLLALGFGSVFLVRWLRWRRRAAGEMWDEAVAEAASQKAKNLDGAKVHVVGTVATVLLAVVATAVLAFVPAAPASADTDDEGTVTITVPAPAVPAGTTGTAVTGTSRSRSSSPASLPASVPEPSPAATGTDLPVSQEVLASEVMPDLLWGVGRQPVTWALVALSAAVAACSGTLAMRSARRGSRRAIGVAS